jgi:hypothetical protein
MTALLERLRADGVSMQDLLDVTLEAADEIERLRKALNVAVEETHAVGWQRLSCFLHAALDGRDEPYCEKLAIRLKP